MAGKARWIGTAAAGALLWLGGCAGRTVVESDLHIKGAPDWVNEGTQILKDRGGRLFHGVGSAPALGDMSLQTSTADNRARAELARILSSYLQVVSRDFTGAAPGAGDPQLEQSVSREIENVTRVNLAGSRIIGRWRDRKTDVIYALAELDLQQVRETAAGVREMNAGFRDHLSAHGDNLFDALAGEGGR